MSKQRPELSKTNPYYISKHRFYELKHFCLQYKDFKRIYNDICNFCPGGILDQTKQKQLTINPDIYEKRLKYLNKIDLIESCAKAADKDLAKYLIIGITEERSFDYLLNVLGIPCCKDVYYDRYRKFFYILSKRKDA